MKKVILYVLILIILFMPTYVKSLTIYGEYKKYKTEVDEFLPESDTLKREEITLYNTYKMVNHDLGYLEKCNNYNENDYLEETLYSKDKLNDSYGYQPILANGKRLQMISLYDFKDVNIKEINIYYKGELIGYYFLKNKDKFKVLNDHDLNTNLILSGNMEITIYFSDNNLNPLELIVEVIGDEINVSSYFTFYDGNTFFAKTKGNYIYFVDNDEYENLKEKYGAYNIQNTVSSYTNVKNYYKKNIRKYHCYKEEKVKTNEYVIDGENLIKDDFIKKYNYYIRSKNIIEDNVEEIKNIEAVTEDNNIVKSEDYPKKETNIKSKTSIKKEKKLSNIDNDEIEDDQSTQEEIVKVEPLVNKVKVNKNKKFKFRYLFLIIFLFFILHILLHCLHRKK